MRNGLFRESQPVAGGLHFAGRQIQRLQAQLSSLRALRERALTALHLAIAARLHDPAATLRASGLQKLREGQTTVEEVVRETVL